MARARLRQAEKEHDRQRAEAEIAVQVAEARLSQARARYPDLTAAQVALKKAVAEEAYAQDEYNKALDRPWEPARVRDSFLRALHDTQDRLAVVQAEYEVARNARLASDQELRILESEVDKARMANEKLQLGVEPLLELEVQQAERALADLSATGVDPTLHLAVGRAEADLQATILRAPFDGAVLEVRASRYENVEAGTPLISLADPGAVEAEVSVIEEDLPLVRVGQSAELFFDALPDAMVEAHVARLSPRRLSDERPLYPVYIAMDNVPADLAPGMTVDAAITIASAQDVLRLPRALVRARGDGTAQVKVWRGGQVETRTVQVGLRGDVYVEIVEGLQEGEQVVGE
jgi:multidrug resistance efflux pump